MASLNLITEPAVTVLARPAVDWWAVSKVRPRYTGVACPGQTLVELAARRCYDSDGKGRPHAEHLRNLLAQGHGSTLEHAQWTFEITGVSRSLTHEWVRHRAGTAVSQESQRYVDCGDVAFVVPPALLRAVDAWQRGRLEAAASPQDQNAGEAWAEFLQDALLVYGLTTDYLEANAPADLTPTERRKWARQAARSVLPNCTETKLVWSANARALRNVIEQRGSRHAEEEIRRLALKLLTVMKAEAPVLFEDFTLTEYAPGLVEAVPLYHKV